MKKIYLSLLSLASCVWINAQTNSVTLTPTGGSTTSYASITAAYAAIPASPSVNYLIEIQTAYNGTDASEVYPIQLTSKGLVLGGATITIRPAAGNNGESIQRVVPAAGAVVQMNGGDNIIFDGRPGGVTSTVSNYLTINDVFVGSSTNRNIELLNDASNNTIQYINSIAADATVAGGSRNILIGSGATLGNNNNTVQNCVVTGGLRGIQDFGLSDAVPNVGDIIKNNTIQNFGAIGIFAGTGNKNITIQSNTVSAASYNVLVTGTTVSLVGIQQQSLVSTTSNITDNTISLVFSSATVTSVSGIVDLGVGTENILRNTIAALSAPAATNVSGISAGSAANGLCTLNISRNKISDLSSLGAVDVRGVSLFPASGSIININNNFVSLTQNNAAATTVLGLLFGFTSSSSNPYTSNVYYNTIRIGGTSSSTGNSSGIKRDDSNTGSTYNQKNNLVINDRSGGTPSIGNVGFYNLGNNAGTLSIDYNSYFSTAGIAANSYAALWNSTGYDNTGITSYQTAVTPQEAHTTFATASFVSNTDLHLTGASITDANIKALVIAGITTDIDGQTRVGATPAKGADEPNITAPVSLVNFTGQTKNTYNVLSWSTVTENGNKGFELQKSADGNDFKTFASIASQAVNGNSTSQLNYTVNDTKPFSANSYYRLKQIDKDGNINFSTIVLLKGKGVTKMEITNLYPNPVTNQFNLVIAAAAKSSIVVTVNDISGKTMMQQSFGITAGDNILPINASALTSGTYIVNVKDETGAITSMKFIK